MNEITVAVLKTPQEGETAQEKALVKAVSEIEVQAEELVISNEEDYQKAANFGRMLKQRSADVKEFWKPMKDAAHKAHAEICDKEKAMLQPLANAEKTLKRVMGAYVAEQERKRREIEEAARKAAQEEAERKLREALEKEASGNKVAAQALVEEADIIDSAPIVCVESKPKASGVSSKKDWKITNVDDSKVPDVVNGVVIRPVDMAAVMRLIRASKGEIKIDGIEYEETVQMSFRK